MNRNENEMRTKRKHTELDKEMRITSSHRLFGLPEWIQVLRTKTYQAESDQKDKMRHAMDDNGIPSKEIHERHRERAITAEEAPDDTKPLQYPVPWSSASSAVTYTSVIHVPVAPLSSDYILGPDEPQTPPVPQDEDEREPMFIQPHDPDYVLEPIYPWRMSMSFRLRSSHYLLLIHLTTPRQLRRCVFASDPEEDPEEYEDDKTEDGLVDYPMDEGEDGDNDDGDSSGDDTNDEDEDVEDEDEEDEKEEEEHLAPPISASRITVRLQASISLPPEVEVERLLAMPTPPTSPPISHHHPRKALVDAVTAALPSPTLPPSLYMLPHVDRRDDIPEFERPPRKRSCLFALGSRYEVDLAEAVPEIAPMNVGEVNTRVTELAELHEHDTQDLYALLEDDQDSKTRISQRVTMDSQRVYAHESQLHAHQTQLQLQGTLIQTQHQVHETRSQMQQAEMAELQETGRRRQAHMVETLRVMRDMRPEMGDMQTELLALREQRRRARQPTPDARVPDHQDASRDADSHI
ncbi:hypothetical protein Tco_1352495 [Tanacetum coccineum]